MIMHQPQYKNRPIASIHSLALALGVNEKYLRSLTLKATHMYRIAKGGRLEKGKIIYDPAPQLKKLQKRINEVIMSAVVFPYYINGGIRGRNYRDDCVLHTQSTTVINLDISKFFESVSKDVVSKLWLRFFNFSPEVAHLLTELTTHKGKLPRGAPTSGYLANLLFYNLEPTLVAKLSEKNITYSRYVDDVSLSMKRYLKDDELTWIIEQCYSMFVKKGVRPNRSKQQVSYGNRPLHVHQINVQGKIPTIPKKIRKGIRAGVYNLQKDFLENGITDNLLGRARVVQGQVAWMGQFHPEESSQLKTKVLNVVMYMVTQKLAA